METVFVSFHSWISLEAWSPSRQNFTESYIDMAHPPPFPSSSWFGGCYCYYLDMEGGARLFSGTTILPCRSELSRIGGGCNFCCGRCDFALLRFVSRKYLLGRVAHLSCSILPTIALFRGRPLLVYSGLCCDSSQLRRSAFFFFVINDTIYYISSEHRF